MKITRYECSCGKIKGDANRWLIGRYILPFIGSEGQEKMIALGPWDEEIAEITDTQHFCGDQCALEWQSRELDRLGR